MRSLSLLCVSGCLFLGFAITGWAADGVARKSDPVVVTRTYSIYDLPVYAGERFDPSILIRLIKSTVDPESWSSGVGSVSAYPQNLSIVVSQTEANHERLVELIASIRQPAENK